MRSPRSALLALSLCATAGAQGRPALEPDPAAQREELAGFVARGTSYFTELQRFGVPGLGERLGALERVAVDERDLAGVARRAAITTFARFLDNHPDDEEFTPDALLRLAQLYRDQASEAPGGDATATRCALGAGRALVLRFPRFRGRDVALYTLLDGLDRDEQRAERLSASLELVCPARFHYAPPSEVTEPPCPTLAPLLPRLGRAPVAVAPNAALEAADPPRCAPSLDARGQPSRLAASLWISLGLQASSDALAFACLEAAVRTDEARRGEPWRQAWSALAWRHLRRGERSEALGAIAHVLDEDGENYEAPLHREAIGVAVDALDPEQLEPPRPSEMAACRRLVQSELRPARSDLRTLRCGAIARLTTRLPQPSPWLPEVYVGLGRRYASGSREAEARTVFRLFLRRFAAHREAPEVERALREAR